MRKIMLVVICYFFFKGNLIAQSEFTMYKAAYNFLQTPNVQKNIKKLGCKKKLNGRIPICTEISKLPFKDSFIREANKKYLLGFSNTFIDSLSIYYKIIPYYNDSLLLLQNGKIDSSFTLFYSKPIGRILMAKIYFSQQFLYSKESCDFKNKGKFLTLLYVFNHDLNKIEDLYISGVNEN